MNTNAAATTTTKFDNVHSAAAFARKARKTGHYDATFHKLAVGRYEVRWSR